jgi:ribosomal protein S27E
MLADEYWSNKMVQDTSTNFGIALNLDYHRLIRHEDRRSKVIIRFGKVLFYGNVKNGAVLGFDELRQAWSNGLRETFYGFASEDEMMPFMKAIGIEESRKVHETQELIVHALDIRNNVDFNVTYEMNDYGTYGFLESSRESDRNLSFSFISTKVDFMLDTFSGCSREIDRLRDHFKVASSGDVTSSSACFEIINATKYKKHMYTVGDYTCHVKRTRDGLIGLELFVGGGGDIPLKLAKCYKYAKQLITDKQKFKKIEATRPDSPKFIPREQINKTTEKTTPDSPKFNGTKHDPESVKLLKEGLQLKLKIRCTKCRHETPAIDSHSTEVCENCGDQYCNMCMESIISTTDAHNCKYAKLSYVEARKALKLIRVQELCSRITGKILKKTGTLVTTDMWLQAVESLLSEIS